MCVGCRQRELRSVLVRLVSRGSTAPGMDVTPTIVVDLHKTEPGRGAWIHQSSQCYELAVRKHAFTRALRVNNANFANVKEYLLGSD